VGHREQQLGANETIFRDVNEAVAAAAGRAGSEEVLFLCECADEFCAESLSLSLDEYEDVRAASERFAVKPGHIRPEIERIVARQREYWVVEKFGDAGEVAEQTDPRG
jgi:hypothetical protein